MVMILHIIIFHICILVEDHLRSSKSTVIPTKAEDCYNKMKFQGYDDMIDIILKFCFDRKLNPHHDPTNKSILFSKSYFDLSENITSYRKLKKNQHNFPLRLNQLSVKYFKPHYRYDKK
jgi:hypothetical protein